MDLYCAALVLLVFHSAVYDLNPEHAFLLNLKMRASRGTYACILYITCTNVIIYRWSGCYYFEYCVTIWHEKVHHGNHKNERDNSHLELHLFIYYGVCIPSTRSTINVQIAFTILLFLKQAVLW